MATQADIERLEKAINSGAMSVQYQDRKVTYRSLEEMRSRLVELRRELGQVPRVVRKKTTFSKGLDSC